MSDRAATLSDLILEHETMQAEAKAEAKARKEELDQLAQRISVLARSIRDGQSDLFEETTVEEPNPFTCEVCGDKVSIAMKTSVKGGRVVTVCPPCASKAVDVVQGR